MEKAKEIALLKVMEPIPERTDRLIKLMEWNPEMMGRLFQLIESNPGTIANLLQLVKSEPELTNKLIEALEIERFFVTISCQKKDKPEDAHDLRHSWFIRNYPRGDVLNTLRHLANDWRVKEQPDAELSDEKGLF